MGLRFLSIFLLFLLFLEPISNGTEKELYPPIVTFLNDNTESIPTQTDTNFLKNTLPKKLQNIQEILEENEKSTQFFNFGTNIKKTTPQIISDYKQSGTNIYQTLEAVNDRYTNQNLGALVLISDGISTEGKNPLTYLPQIQVPIFTVLLGDTSKPRDLLIEKVLHNEIVYKDNDFLINATATMKGFSEANTELSLYHNGKLLDSKKIHLDEENHSKDLEFKVKAGKVGLHQYTLVLKKKKGELTFINNRKTIFIRVLENKVKIRLFAGSAHPDIGALKRIFERDERFDFKTFVHKNGSALHENPKSSDFGDADLFIFHNFPQFPNDNELLKSVNKSIEEKNTPILNIIGINNSLNNKDAFKFSGVFPKNIRQNKQEAQLNLKEDYLSHATYTFDQTFANWIQNAPPLLRNSSVWDIKANTKVFGTTKIKNIPLNYPMLVFQENLGRKSITILGENIWRWRIDYFQTFKNFDNFDLWIHNLVQWLVTKQDKRKFKTYAIKPSFSGTEKAILKAEVYDDVYKPIGGVEIKLNLQLPNGKTTDYYFNEESEANYYLELSKLAEGKYSFTAIGKKNGKTLGTDKGFFSVGKTGVEYVKLQADYELMYQMAKRSGGKFYFAKNFDSLADDILKLQNLKPISELRQTSKSWHEYLFPLILVLMLLSAEWILRKYYGLS